MKADLLPLTRPTRANGPARRRPCGTGLPPSLLIYALNGGLSTPSLSLSGPGGSFSGPGGRLSGPGGRLSGPGGSSSRPGGSGCFQRKKRPADGLRCGDNRTEFCRRSADFTQSRCVSSVVPEIFAQCDKYSYLCGSMSFS
jgi:hypothetical protein